MAKDSISGKGGYITLSAGPLPINSWEGTSDKEMCDSTDSSNYDTGTGQLWAAQVPGKQSQEVQVEGNWSLGSLPGVIAQLKNDVPVTATLGLTPTITFCSGTYDISNVKVSLKVDDPEVVTYSLTLKSNGKITYS